MSKKYLIPIPTHPRVGAEKANSNTDELVFAGFQ